jgi:large subunit ribosomal protein L10
MPNAKKEAVVTELTDKFQRAEVAVLLDYRGLSAEETEDFRSEAKKAGVELRVKKNRLIKIALKNAECEIPEEALKNPTMIAFGYEDPASAPKMLTKYAKDQEKIVLKGGVFEGKALSEAGVKELATLPTKEELLGRLVGSIGPQNTLGRMMRSIQNPAQKLVYGLRALAETKS